MSLQIFNAVGPSGSNKEYLYQLGITQGELITELLLVSLSLLYGLIM
jgi:hypothetical protein